MIILGLIGTAISITGQYFAAKSSTGSCRMIRKDLFYHIGDLTYKDLDETGTSRLITTMTSDVNLTELGINRFLRLILRSPFIIAGATVMAMMINIKMSLIFWIVIAILITMIYIIMRTVTPMNRGVQEQLEKATRAFR